MTHLCPIFWGNQNRCRVGPPRRAPPGRNTRKEPRNYPYIPADTRPAQPTSNQPPTTLSLLPTLSLTTHHQFQYTHHSITASNSLYSFANQNNNGGAPSFSPARLFLRNRQQSEQYDLQFFEEQRCYDAEYCRIYRRE